MKMQIKIFIILLSVLNTMPVFVNTCNAISIPDLSNLGIGVSSGGVSCAQKGLPEHAAKDAKLTGTPPDCKVSGCEDGYKPSSDGTKCISTPELDKCLNSTSRVTWENGKCVCVEQNEVWNNILKKCELSKTAKAEAKEQKKNLKEENKTKSKTACEQSGEGIVKGKWLGANCQCPSGSKLSVKGHCELNTGVCKDVYGKGEGTYSKTTGKCEIAKCNDKNYTLNETTKKCELNTTHDIKEKEADKKAFLSDAKKLHDSFTTVSTNLINTKE